MRKWKCDDNVKWFTINVLSNFYLFDRKKFIIFQFKDESKFSNKIKIIKARKRKQALLQNETIVDFVKTKINDRNVKIYLKSQLMKIFVYVALFFSEQKTRLKRKWKFVKKRKFREKRSTKWMKLNNIRKIATMLQISTKKKEKNENAEILNLKKIANQEEIFSLKKIANQAAFFQRTLSNDRVKLKRRFKFN